ncbi:M20 family metallopeptidase [Micromonospora sp. NBC_00617]|uniref:M20 family metallopeptidase n=1 Tax=Micromonospora sp. NBC_00617 TaxID=2903587 RepID=UPI0030DE8CD8
MTETVRTHEDAVAAVLAQVERDHLLEAVCGLVDRSSPTGAERQAAEWLVDHLAAAGVDSTLQVIDDAQANAIGVLRGPDDGESVLLYAPLDTYTTGDADLDIPFAGPRMREDMLPRATVYDDLIIGLGASNPKGHAACVLVAVEAMARAGIDLPVNVVAAFGAGGMPSFAIDGVGVPGRMNTGHGIGASFLLERGFATDHAIIAKPGWTVSHEEVGLTWVDVEVPGEHSYVGSRHRMPYRNAASAAARVIEVLEAWCEEYAVRHEAGTMRPQGVVSSVHGGFERLAASTTALVRVRLDVRMTPEQTAPAVVREVRAALAPLEAEFGAPLVVRQVASVPGTRTDPAARIVRSAVAAWESVAGQPHELVLANSGATDANMIRMRGIPTARVGMPKIAQGPNGRAVDFTLGMNAVDLKEAKRLVEVLVRTVVGLEEEPLR